MKHHCPACRHVIPSKRHIIKDTNFDDMIRSLKCSREESTEDIDISAYRKNHQARVKDMKIYQAANKTRILSQPYIAPVSRTSLGDNVSASKKRGRQSKDHLSDPPTASHPEYSQSYLGSSVKFSMKYYNPQVSCVAACVGCVAPFTFWVVCILSSWHCDGCMCNV